MTLGDKQRLFARLIGEFIVWCYVNDYEITFGEATRPPELAALYASQGRGIANSLHGKRLALDINLFLDSSLEADEDVYQKDSEAYLPLGKKWESMHPLCRWGGRFSKPDGNHFSLEHEGVR
jgi:hypothetical protein